MRIGYDAKRIVSNGTGLGSYGRTLINSLAALEGDDELLLYAPDEGRKEWREQVRLREGVRFVYSDRKHGLGKSLWRSHGIVEDLRRDGVSLYHGLSGELPVGLRKAGIPGIVTIHDRILPRHRRLDLQAQVLPDAPRGRPHHRHQRTHPPGHHRAGWLPPRPHRPGLSELRHPLPSPPVGGRTAEDPCRI